MAILARRSVLILGLAALSACVTAPAPSPEPAAGLGLLEPVFSASAGPDGLTIRVRSSGCTRKEDFAFYVERRPEGAAVAFGRKRVDVCKASTAPPVALTFSYAELGLDPARPVVLLNPLAGGAASPQP